MSEQEKPSYYMIRAKEQTEENFRLFFEENVAAIGWSRVNVRQLESAEDVEQALDEHYDFWSKAAPQVRGRRRNEILRFLSIEEGDRIIVPYYSSVALATATGKHRYAPEVRDSLDLSNQVEVEYPRSEGDVVTVPREELSEGLQRRLRVRGSTVSNLEEFADEIDALFEGKGFTWQARLEKEEEQRRKEFQRQLLHNIRDGQTNLQAGGVGLEQLVARLLECEGYDATVLSKQAFPGLSDADVKASRSDRFGEQQLLVQVKHHRGTSGSWGAKQLASIREHLPDQYGDYQLVLVTTADVSDKLEAECEEQDIACVDGEELAEWISDHADHLGPELRRKLGISAVPELTV